MAPFWAQTGPKMALQQSNFDRESDHEIDRDRSHKKLHGDVRGCADMVGCSLQKFNPAQMPSARLTTLHWRRQHLPALFRCPTPSPKYFIGDEGITRSNVNISTKFSAQLSTNTSLLATAESPRFAQMPSAQLISQLSSQLQHLSRRRWNPPVLLRCPDIRLHIADR